jgi:peptidoglycan/xylan/chitin deacetylase (PgdA/CDA1 family)
MLLLLPLGVSMVGCHHVKTPVAMPIVNLSSAVALSNPRSKETPPVPKGPLPPNEVGVIPILEYHDVGPTEKFLCRSVVNFRHDLDRLYTEGYRPIRMKEYLDNRIDLPAGFSPVLLTFDDARKSQFRYLPDGTLDPDCAIAIMQDFHAQYPDFAVRATFFVLPDTAFGQPRLAAQKLQTLLEMGCEIGNHTVTHRMLHRLSDAEVQKEIETCKMKLEKLAPKAQVDTLAFPGGHMPRNRSLILKGTYQGRSYTNRAGFLASSNPAPSPISVKLDWHRIERIAADERMLGITFWLDRLKRNPRLRYVSDGDPNVVTVPRAKVKFVDQRKLNGAMLEQY